MIGKFIVFEGLDGAGTSTQMKLVLDSYINIELTHEPTNGPFGVMIRQAIEGRIDICSESLGLAFAADRSDHLHNPVNGIFQNLSKGINVISDRYIMSNIAYQVSHGVDKHWLKSVNSKFVKPDLTIFIKTNVENCVKRIDSRSNKPELFHDYSKLERINDVFMKEVNDQDYYGKVEIIDGNTSVEEVFKTTIQAIEKII